MKKINTNQSGFSAVEMLITIVIAAIFIQAFYTLFNTVNTSNGTANEQANASGYAYWYLRSYTSSAALYSVPCNNNTDLTLPPGTIGYGTGYALPAVNGSNASFPLPSPVALQGRFYYPMGCAAGSPRKIDVTVTWGPQSKVVRHGTYVY